MFPQPARLTRKRRGAATGHRPRRYAGREHGQRLGRLRGCGRRSGLGGVFGSGLRLFDDHVGVGAADTERGDGGAARAVGVGPGAGFGEQADVSGVPVHLGGRLVGVQCLGQHAVADGLDHFDDARDARGGLGVADVGLDRPEPQRSVVGAVLAVGGEQRLGLDRVAEGGAGAVAFHGVDVGGRQSGGVEGLLDHAALRRAAGRGQAVGGAVLVDCAAAYHGEYGVSVAAGVGQALQQQDARALGPAGAVGVGGVGAAAAVAREAALFAELDEGLGRGHDADAAGQGECALPRAQRLGCPLEGDER